MRGVAQPGRAPALGAGCRRFESCHPDDEKSGRLWRQSLPLFCVTKMFLLQADAKESEIYGLLQAARNFGELGENFLFAARNRNAHSGETQGSKEVIILA